MDTFVNLAAQYGPGGLIILACFWYILYKDKAHREERKHLSEILARQHHEALEVTRNNTQIAQNNTSVLTEIATLIKFRNK